MENIYTISDFGACAQAEINTEAIQQAIDTCALNGGGVVEIPSGTYRTGTLRLCSNLTIYLSPGAVLKGSSDMQDYRSFGYTHCEFGDVLSLFYAENCTNLSFAGSGTIDFNSEAFFDKKRAHSKKIDVEKLTPEQEQYELAYEVRPNQMMFFHNCQKIRISNIHIMNAACWGVVFSNCSEIYITGLQIRNSLRVPNCDGIHLSSCKNVIIKGCDIVSGDDCIAITCIDGWEFSSENTIISDCLLCSASAGVRIGYWHSRVKNVRITNCIMYECTRGICVMSCGQGLVEDVCIPEVSIQTTGRVGGWWGIGEPVYIMALPHEVQNHRKYLMNEPEKKVNVKNITFSGLKIKAVNPMVMVGNANISDIRFYQTEYSAIDHPNEAFFGDQLDLNPSQEIRSKDGNAYWGYFEGVKNLKVEDIRITDCRSKRSKALECFCKDVD